MIHNKGCLYRFSSKNWKILLPSLKTKAEEIKKVKYTDTINLPKTKFPARINQKQRNDLEEVIRSVSLFIHLTKN